VRRGDPLLVRGWALSAAGPIAFDAVEVRFADGTAFDAITGLARPDVCAVFGLPAETLPGFTAVVPTDNLPPGPLTAEVLGRLGGGSALPVGRFSFTLIGPRRRADLTPGVPSQRVIVDPPVIDRNGAAPVLVVRGWALDGLSRPGLRVVVSIGEFGGEAIYGYARADVCAALGLSPLSEPCGFELRVPCDEVAIPALVVAHCDDVDGTRSSSAAVALPADFATPPLAAPAARGAIDELQVIDSRDIVTDRLRAVRARDGDRLVLSGWAAHEGEPGAELVAVIDGYLRQPVGRRIKRADVAAAGLGPPHAGFVTTIRLRGLPAGLHVVEIFARRADGTLVPTAARATVEIG
jgi:hypothetical protein